MRKLTFIISLVFVQLASAANQDIFDIIDLADQVKLAARTTTADDQSLEDAKIQLKQVLDLLNQTGNQNPGPDQRCVNFAYSKYSISLSSNTATTKAIEACRKIKDLPTAEFLFEKFYINLNAVNSMDQAADQSGVSKIGKMDMLSFMYEKYYMTLSSSSAAQKASQAADILPRGRLNCLQNLYSKYSQSLSSSSSMDKAVQDCR